MNTPLNLVIAGCGLLGGSFGLALRGHPDFRRILWARSAAAREWALRSGAADDVCERPEDAFSQADLTIMALPIPVICSFMRRYASVWKKGSVVSDMGSVKGVICKTAEATLIPKGVVFIGGHPMAGTEKSGFRNAFPSLFRGADVFLCPGSNADMRAVNVLSSLWISLHTHVIVIDPEKHDDVVAHTSHVQHIVASALTHAILGCADPTERALRWAGCASGFRDTSRIASSDPVMWREIVENNTDAILGAMDSFESKLAEMRGVIEQRRFEDFQNSFANGKAMRDAWLADTERKKL